MKAPQQGLQSSESCAHVQGVGVEVQDNTSKELQQLMNNEVYIQDAFYAD